MAAGYDGSIKINTEITTKRASSQLLSLENRITKTADKMERIKDQMRSMETVKIPTKEFEDLSTCIEGAKFRVEELEAALEKAKEVKFDNEWQNLLGQEEKYKQRIQAVKEELAKPVTVRQSGIYEELNSYEIALKNIQNAKQALKDGSYWRREAKELEDAKAQLSSLESKMKELEASGKAFTITAENPKITEDYGKLQSQLKYLEADMTVLVRKQEELNAKMGQADLSNVQKGLKKSIPMFEKFRSAGEGAMKKVGKAASAFFSKMHSGSRSSENAIEKLSRRIWGLAKRVFVFSLITKSFRAMVSGMQEGLKNFARYSDEYNKVMSDWATSTGTLKNSMATAFATIISQIIPALTQLVDWMTIATNAVSQFSAIISGKSTWTKATRQQVDYAESLDKTASSAKKAAGALASFDTLEVLNKNNSGGGSGVDPKDMFEEVPVEEGFEFDPHQLGKNFSDWLADGLENIDWDNIEDKAEEAGRNIARFLNGVWENERLAADLGMTMGEALNTAVRFAYGFIDENEWMQMGRFLGTIVQTGLNTFDEEKAGETAGKLFNGLSDAVIGYFQTYEAGSLGSEIAGFLNRAVEEVNADKVGMAASLLVGGFFAEIGSFFDDVTAEEIGSKVSQAFIKFFTYAGNDGTVGERVGYALAGAINTGVDLLLGADFSGMSRSLGSFLTDALISAVENIEWTDVFKALVKGFALLHDFPIEVGKGAGASILKAIGLDDEQIDAVCDRIPTLGKAIDELGSSVATLQAKAYIEKNNTILDVEKLQSLQEEFGLTDSAIDNIIQTMMDMNSQLDMSALGLEGYQGSWTEFKESTITSISDVKTANDEMVNSISNGAKVLEDDFQRSSSFVINKNAEMATSTSSARELIGQEHVKINDSLNATDEKAAQTAEKVSELSENAAISLSGVNSQYSETLDNMTSMTDEWFSGMSQYFSTEQWQQFSDNITGSMLGCLDTMTNDWTTMLDEWMIQNDEMYFGYDIWYEQFENILLAYADVDAEFQSEWQASTDTWWSTMVVPFFEIAQWQLFGTNMKTGIMQGFKSIVNDMGGVLNKVIGMFDEAFKELEESMNDLIDSYNKSASALGTSTLSRVHYKPMGGIKIPELAEGAVIRGGSPFLAILGDQPSGQTNIEAPQSAIEEAVAAGLRRAGGNGGTLQINLNYDGETFARLSLKDILAEMDRQGYDIDVLGGLP